jgi:lipopolysaccharide export system protein LptA
LVHRILAENEVEILSESDRSHARGGKAVYSEADGLFELTGKPVWRTEDRMVKGERLIYDRTNEVFRAVSNAYLRLPVSALGRLQGFSPGAEQGGVTNDTRDAFVEVFSNDIEYHPGRLEFIGNVRGYLLTNEVLLGRFTSRDLVVKFSNQVERVQASGHVVIEQVAHADPRGVRREKSLASEVFEVLFTTNGNVRTLFARDHVEVRQTEFRPGEREPVRTWMTAGMLIATMTGTNELQTIQAETNVVVRQESPEGPRSATGERAVYLASEDAVVLTGDPVIELPEGTTRDAETVIYDRKTGTFRSQGASRTTGREIPGLGEEPLLLPPPPP